jgi:hypothetical protein
MQGCGCGTCSFAWGGQSSCNRPAEPGVRTGLNVPTTTYDDREPPLVAGMRPRPFIKMARGALGVYGQFVAGRVHKDSAALHF